VTSASPTLEASAAAPAGPSRGAWIAELLLVGGGTLVLFPLAWLLRRAAGPDSAEDAVDFAAYHAALLINNPHFAVTYLLFYKGARRRALGRAFPPAQRARYVFAGLVVPILLVAWAARAVATGSARTMGFLIQLMFLLVGWHYVKQGFGILTVLSARRGFRFSPFERRVVLAHCFAGWAYAWASPFDPGRAVHEKGVVYTSIAHPAGLEQLTFAAFALSTLALIAVFARKWRAERSFPPLAPLTGFLVSIWLWTVYSSVDRLMMYVIPALHSIQYLYMVWLLKRNEAREAEGPPLFGRPTALVLGVLALASVALGWLLFRGAPQLLDGALVLGATPGDRTADLGPTPYLAAIFVVVNIHHYFMDHVIWRRDNPDTRYLRHVDAPAAAEPQR
jgi:hypothetical protein